MSTTEIIAELSKLTPRELEEIQEKITQWVAEGHSDDRRSNTSSRGGFHVYSPRFANPGQAKNFVKQIVEVSADDQL